MPIRMKVKLLDYLMSRFNVVVDLKFLDVVTHFLQGFDTQNMKNTIKLQEENHIRYHIS